MPTRSPPGGAGPYQPDDSKICAFCRHHVKAGNLAPECHRLMHKKDLVTGEPRGALRFCHSERKNENLFTALLGIDRCGPAGLFYEKAYFDGQERQ